MRKGNWMQTFSGRRFYPLDPAPEDICIEDIAHALSLTCRYNGHCRTFYSVAEHSVRMSLLKPGCPKWGLLHDAAEAYISDIPSPIKPMLSEFKNIEDRIISVIAEKYKLGLPDYKEADLIMLSTERRDVVTFRGVSWTIELPEPLLLEIYPWPWEVAENMFLSRAKELAIKE